LIYVQTFGLHSKKKKRASGGGQNDREFNGGRGFRHFGKRRPKRESQTLMGTISEQGEGEFQKPDSFQANKESSFG